MQSNLDKQLEELTIAEWLRIDPATPIVNPFHNRTQEEIENPHLFLLNMLRNPDYFYLTCKYILNLELDPFQLAILKELWVRKYPMLIATRGGSKTFLLAVYALLRALIKQGTKVVMVGAGFRQAKLIFSECERIWYQAPVLRDMIPKSTLNGPKKGTDEYRFNLHESVIYAVPLGDGSKIRGYRANTLLNDEFHSINQQVYENVVSGFAAVVASPVENVKRKARMKVYKKLGILSEDDGKSGYEGNQEIISGTPYYHFNHFYKYWQRYKKIVESRGDIGQLLELFPEGIPEGFNHKNYSIIRLPYDLLPEGFMDLEHIAKHRATATVGNYNLEYGAVFENDSNGFFKRSLIESCVCKVGQSINLSSGPVSFSASLTGNKHLQYVYGLDPASEKDNFSFVILEVHDDHCRLVYCWTMTRALHAKMVKKGVTDETNFYAYCARKVRDKKKVFPCDLICMDSQGGGYQVSEALHDKDKLQDGEKPYWEVIDEEKPKETDDFSGEHIIQLVNFSDAQYTNTANHGLKKDMTDKALLFPYFDPGQLALDEFTRKGDIEGEFSQEDAFYDTLENCVWEIEQLKDELATIEHSQTINGRDKWDTPQFKLPGGKIGRYRKDRYSALLMANAGARGLKRAFKQVEYEVVGAVAKKGVHEGNIASGPLYRGPAWFVKGNVANGSFGAVLRQGKLIE